MFYGFRVGPIPAEEGDLFLYAAWGTDGVLGPVHALKDEAGFAELKELAKGPVTVTTEHKAVAKQLGFTVGNAPEEATQMRALMSVAIQWQDEEKVDLQATHRFVRAAAAYFDCEPWEMLDFDSPIDIEVTGSSVKPVVARVVSGDELGFGLALFFEAGDELFERAGDGAPDSITAVTEPEPEWIAKAVKDWTTVAVAPGAVVVEKGEQRDPTGVELDVLSAAMLAVAKFADLDPEELVGRSGDVTVRLKDLD